uniref:Uncharacterized protein n=1 Tax=Anopheles minimus TaxID=112268 RepID=A0A182WQF2_9DIPT
MQFNQRQAQNITTSGVLFVVRPMREGLLTRRVKSVVSVL